MTAKQDDGIEVNVEGSGCLFFFGIIIIASCIGSLYSAVHGWLVFGTCIVLWALFSAARK